MANEEPRYSPNVRQKSLLVVNRAQTETRRLRATDDGELLVGVNLTTITDGRKTVATGGTAERLVASSTAAKYVFITAETDNTGIITVGASTVVAALATRRGTPLSAGDTLGLPIDDLNDIFLDTTVNGDGVTYTALN